jgi:nitroimidazol reductase NimA-like FMN-containing flavoprotein (pyridoxamine 5'-phosphate oxidase superfamily)
MDFTHGTADEMTREENERLLRSAPYGRLGLAFENEAYVVPISHHFDGARILFHIARQGKKTTYLQANPQACFEVDEWTAEGWASAICYGTVTLSDALDARREFIRMVTGVTANDGQLQHMDMFVGSLAVDEMTGRKSHGYVVPSSPPIATSTP